jgi:stalled ribosome rescue protein Dom34
MKTNAGLWLDHREAVIVVLSDSGEATIRLQSGASKQLRRSSEPSEGRFKSHEAPAPDVQESEFMGHLDRFYDEIIASVSGAERILIIGPGEAKGELKKRFEKHKSESRAITVETAAQMTEPQVVAQVRHHYRFDAARRP